MLKYLKALVIEAIAVYIDAFKKQGVYSGRTGRKDFWLFFLVTVMIGVAVAVIDNVFRLINPAFNHWPIGMLYSAFALGPLTLVGGVVLRAVVLRAVDQNSWALRT